MPTYTPLQSIQLTTSASSVTFSGIPQNYQDLVIVGNVQLTSSGQSFLYQYNGDTATNYSLTILKGNGSSATSDRRSNINYQLAAGWDAGLPTSTSYASAIINIQNYSNSTTYKTSINRGSNAAGGDVTSTICLWRNTEAITSITLYTGTGSLASGSTFDLYGISPVAAQTAQAFGGTEIYYDSSYVYHVFKGSGTFTPYRNLTADLLVVAGGGGANNDSSGGGGAGGLLQFTSQSLTSNTSYTVTVGAGGSYITNGNNSRFGVLTECIGGGRAGGNATAPVTGASGGSGGGGYGGGTITAGTGTAGQGNNGGAGFSSDPPYGGGGGGGAGAAGNAGRSTSDGAGGIGATSSLINSIGAATGTGQFSGGNYYFAGGGGGNGGLSTAGVGGLGGGGNGGYSADNSVATSGTTNTGGGAGGGNSVNKRSGGSGIVIVRYAR